VLECDRKVTTQVELSERCWSARPLVKRAHLWWWHNLFFLWGKHKLVVCLYTCV
jgi:hypothetical protein